SGEFAIPGSAQTFGGAEPDSALAILEDCANDVAGETVSNKISFVFPLLEPLRPAAEAPDPEGAFSVDHQRRHEFERRHVLPARSRERAVSVLRQAGPGPNPDRTGAVLANRIGVIRHEAVV